MENSGSQERIPNSKQPSKSKFKQQKLAAWQPIITARTVLPYFIILGLLFIGLGILILYYSNQVQEIQIDYTDCTSILNPSNPCSNETYDWDERIKAEGLLPVEPCQCEVSFKIDTMFEGQVYMYYALTNFYQNHRRYIKSRDDAHLYAKNLEVAPSTNCHPYDVKNASNPDKDWYYPCGVIANSMFQDDITLYARVNTTDELKSISLIRTGIAWESDKKYKFKNPSNWAEDPTSFKNDPKFIKPPAWRKDPFELDLENLDNNGVQNEDFIIWMRTAALPNFRKLYRKINHEQEGLEDGLPEGEYLLKINYTYPVKAHDGTKSIIFSTTSIFGGKNQFLGIAYISLGSICLFLGILFICVHLKYGKSSREITHID